MTKKFELNIEIPNEVVNELKKLGVDETDIPKIYFDFIEYETSYGIRDISKFQIFLEQYKIETL
jgi:hypothetical protein